MAAEKPLIIRDKDQMRKWSKSMRAQGNSIAFVPTMGFLHNGHLSLVDEARKHADLIVVSIYINPGQFSPNEDLSRYPSNFSGDIEKLKSVQGGVDVVFHPSNLYDYGVHECGERGKEEKGAHATSCVERSGGGHETWIRVEKLEKGLCGKSRPVFFRGVATVVAKLFNIVEPDVAVFGKKDYQQWRIIRRMVRDLDFGIKIIGCELVRERDGMAMSSRNVLLSPEEREKALTIYESVFEAKRAGESGERTVRILRNYIIFLIEKAGGKVDYVEIVDQESLESVEVIQKPAVICAAAWFGNVRLIDNMEVNV